MSICILNKESDKTKSCLPDTFIKELQKDVLQTEHNSTDKIIKELAKKTNCATTSNIQYTEIN